MWALWGKGIRGNGRGRRIIKNLENEMRQGEKCMYFVCDFNGKWLMDSSFLCSLH
jgi:hypothetical protein